MFQKKYSLLLLFSAALSTQLKGEDETEFPDGSLNAERIFVIPNNIARLTWDITFPTRPLTEVVLQHSDNSPLTPRSELRLTVKVLGTGFGPSTDPYPVSSIRKSAKTKTSTSVFEVSSPKEINGED